MRSLILFAICSILEGAGALVEPIPGVDVAGENHVKQFAARFRAEAGTAGGHFGLHGGVHEVGVAVLADFGEFQHGVQQVGVFDAFGF